MELAQRAGTKPSAALFPSVEIGTACCNHGICAAACPGGALLRHEGDAASGILFDPTACLACGVCVEVCPEHAVRLLPQGNPAHAVNPVELHRLAHRSCSECGEKFTGKSESQVCPACAKRHAMGASLFGIGSADSSSSATGY
jgi:ferredoxin